MEPSSLVFAAIVGVWAVYLVPQWLRHGHQAAASRGPQDSAGARVLAPRRRPARQAAAGSSRPVLASGPSSRPAQAASSRAPGQARRSGSERRPAARSSAQRRAQVLAVLVGWALVGWALVGWAVVPWAAGLPATALLLLDLVALRLATRRRQSVDEVRASRVARRRAAGSTAARGGGLDSAVAPSQAAPSPVPADRGPKSADEPTEEVAAQPAAYDGTWVPVPVPLPLYTLKPTAPRWDLVPRERPVAIADPVPAVAEEDLAPLDLDAVLQRRRAVNI